MSSAPQTQNTPQVTAAAAPAAAPTTHSSTATLLAIMLRAAPQVSDLFFSPGKPPMVEVHGRLTQVGSRALTPSMRRPVEVNYYLPLPSNTVAMLPFALSMSDWFRSVHVGRSRFSRCCHLINDLGFILPMKVGPGVRRSHRNSALAFVFSLPGTVLLCFSFLIYAAAVTATRLLLCNGSYTSPLTHR
jgi:hypothetical protein